MQRFLPPIFIILAISTSCFGAATLWNFSDPSNRLAAVSGTGTLTYHDPDGTGWGSAGTAFGKASSFGLPEMPGGDADVMRFPACTSRQGFRITHNSPANGPYGETANRISNYTLIFDVLFPAASDARWRALYQTDTNNANDAEFYVQNTPGGGIGTINVYNGSIRSNTWHRIAIVMQSAPGEGKCQRFIDGQFAGGIGSSGSALDLRWSLDRALLLLTDNNNETAGGYLSSFYFVDRAMRMDEIEALGGPHAAGANVPGAPATPLPHRMLRKVGVIGHRGGFFCCAPDNTMASVRYALSNNVPVIEIDTQLSADGVCVLVHDSTIDRTTDGVGAVASLTVAQLKQYDAGSWFSPEFTGERIPTAAEVMLEARGRMILYFDLKVPGQINAIMNALDATGFNPDDCWFWVYNNASDAASIRARVPNAKIIWEAPGSWSSDPNFFNTMRNIGVYAFDQGVYYGTVSSAFTLAAKQQGFIVSIYTILDPDTMVRNAAAGVDFMETDFPHVMNQLQPPQIAHAAGGIPISGATNVTLSPTLTWVIGSNAIAHRIYFGTNSTPAFLREQSYDLVPLTNLLAGTTYYWRIDEVTPSGVLTGAVWNFITSGALLPINANYEWTFDRADLSAALGGGTMEYADNATANMTVFGTTDGATVPHIGGRPATYVRVPGFTNGANGYLLSFNDSGANGGGAFINRFTFIADVLVPETIGWTALFNTNPDNDNDADWYIDNEGHLGIAELGYSSASLASNVWYRIAFTADLGANAVRYHVNGALVHQRTGLSPLDGRFSLYSRDDPGPDLLLFNEGNASGVFTHELLVASVAFVDRTLTPSEIFGLGVPNADGIFIRRLVISRTGPEVRLDWAGGPNIRLQRSIDLSPNATWQNVNHPAGASTYTETSAGPAFYRLRRD
jgi:glycerophosphoryl diester phosphodiesterase